VPHGASYAVPAGLTFARATAPAAFVGEKPAQLSRAKTPAGVGKSALAAVTGNSLRV